MWVYQKRKNRHQVWLCVDGKPEMQICVAGRSFVVICESVLVVTAGERPLCLFLDCVVASGLFFPWGWGFKAKMWGHGGFCLVVQLEVTRMKMGTISFMENHIVNALSCLHLCEEVFFFLFLRQFLPYHPPAVIPQIKCYSCLVVLHWLKHIIIPHYDKI